MGLEFNPCASANRGAHRFDRSTPHTNRIIQDRQRTKQARTKAAATRPNTASTSQPAALPLRPSKGRGSVSRMADVFAAAGRGDAKRLGALLEKEPRQATAVRGYDGCVWWFGGWTDTECVVWWTNGRMVVPLDCAHGSIRLIPHAPQNRTAPPLCCWRAWRGTCKRWKHFWSSRLCGRGHT